jgi:hypothetical protein
MTSTPETSPAGKVMNEAIELAIEERSPFPERSLFIDEDSPSLGDSIKRAAAEGRAVVLVSADGSSQVLVPQSALPHR